MTIEPDETHVLMALDAAAMSPCRSKRGVVLYDPASGAHRGSGYNGPPGGACPGRAICAGSCGQRSVHAEIRALRVADVYRRHTPRALLDLVHVELGPDRTVVACDGPSCAGCAAQILDVGFVGGVWLYERASTPSQGAWVRYTAAAFYDLTLARCQVNATIVRLETARAAADARMVEACDQRSALDVEIDTLRSARTAEGPDPVTIPYRT